MAERWIVFSAAEGGGNPAAVVEIDAISSATAC
ncbi:MAG: hypothetical protein JWN04_5024 [Myxococcaceae bacterium]|nr:hypothetical protein [Myxococcaceae bacterium]